MTNHSETTAATSVKAQYEDAAYSKFVESQANASLYSDYLHYSFFRQMEGIVETQLASGDKRQVSVLDLGCGNAVLGRKLLKRNLSATAASDIRVTGVDQSTSMLQEARRLCKEDGLLVASDQLTLVEGNATSLPSSLAAASFDIVMSGFVLVHMETETMLHQFFEQVASKLKSGGQTLHINPCFQAGSNEAIQPPSEGASRLVHLPVLNDETGQVEHTIELYDFFWSTGKLVKAAEAAGLVDVTVTPAKIDPEATSSWTHETLPVHILLLSARKP